MKKNTSAIRTRVEKTEEREHSTPIFLTSSYLFDSAEHGRQLFADEIDGNIYSRYSNPNSDELAKKMALLEETESAMAVATGMSAIFTSMMAFLKSGDHILVSRSVFGSTIQIVKNLLPRWNIEYTFIDADDIQGWQQSIKKNTKMLFIESPTNPGLDIIDLKKAGDFAKENQLLFSVDNCFSTPILQTPVDFGADIIIHSATKYLDGQGRSLGGIICGSEKVIKECDFLLRNTGPTLSPFNSWLISKSLETLDLRVKKHSESAFDLAQWLEKNDEIETIRYPFLKSHPQYLTATSQMKLGGGIVTFELKGDTERSKKFLDALEMISLSANLGDTRTIATHPAFSTHSKLTPEERQRVGITDRLIRISVGLESIEDIIYDIEKAINVSK